MNQRKLALSVALGALLTLGLVAGLGLSRTPAQASPEAASSAHVVVQFADGNKTVRPITWVYSITRVGALKAAGLSVEHIGDSVCSIEGDGCPATDCFCPANWWAQGQWDGTAWDTTAWPPPELVDGDVVAFRNAPPPSDWGLAGLLPGAPTFVAVSNALEWMRDQQQPDGSFGTVNDTVETLMAVSANGLDGATWRHSPSLLATVLSSGPEFANRNAAGAGKLAVALTAQGACWPISADSPLDHYDAGESTFSPDTLYQGWGILGAATLSESVPISAVVSLKNNQQDDGGWELFRGFGADTNATALAMQALIAAGEPVTSTSVVSGLAYLEGAQNDDGGFPYSPDSPWGTDSDTNSTAYVVQALYAAGEDPLTGTWAAADGDPISYLLSMQLPDGSFEWQEGFGSNQLATQQAIPALLHRSYPMRISALDSCYGISGQVVSGVGGSENPMPGVRVEADGADDLFFGITDDSGTYTLSVPAAETYTVTPSRDGFTFTPTIQTVDVSETPGDVTQVPDFAGQTRVHLPLIIRD